MEVKVVAFGIARDIIGENYTTVSLKGTLSARELMGMLNAKFPEFEKLNSLRLAVNESYVEDDFLISEGDELVLIPPVSGG